MLSAATLWVPTLVILIGILFGRSEFRELRVEINRLREDNEKFREGMREEFRAFRESMREDQAKHRDEVRRDLAGIAATMSSLEVRVAGLESRMDRLDGRMDRLDGRMDALDGRMDRLDGRMDALDGRMDALEANNAKLRQEFADFREQQRRDAAALRAEVLGHIVTIQNAVMNSSRDILLNLNSLHERVALVEGRAAA